jgi:Glycosyl transferase family 2
MNDTPHAGSDETAAPPEVSLIIPCLNEEQNVPMLVEKLSRLLESFSLRGEILIVDDCSDDYTFREAYLLSQRYPHVRALHKGLPRGIGRSIRFGIANARGRLAVVVMGDLVDPLAAIPDFRNKIVDEGYQLVLLSRYLDPEDGQSIPALYRFYQFWFRLLCRLLVGVRLTDATYAEASPRATGTAGAWTWAALMRRVFDLDVLACPRCGGRLRVLATVQASRAVQAILAYRARSGAPASPGPAPHPRPPQSRSPRLSSALDAAPDGQRRTPLPAP